MTTLSASDARDLVRKNLDELDPNGSIMYNDENGSTNAYGDNRSLDEIIFRCLPEAINAVHMAAPVTLLEGESASPANMSISDKVLSFDIGSGSKYLRLVAFRAKDSDIVVTDTIPEASPEGRKQLNAAIRGRKDRPRLVLLQDGGSDPSFKYYTTDETTTGTAVAFFKYVKEQTYRANTVSDGVTTYTSYNISRRLRQNIIDCCTAMVMDTFGDQRAQSFYSKANSFQSI